MTKNGASSITVNLTRQFKGKKIDVDDDIVIKDYIVTGQEINETERYKKWQGRNYQLMLGDLFGILIGRIFQLIVCRI